MPIELVPITRTTDDPKISTKGSFMAGTTAVFFFTFADIEGTLYNPSDITITILDSDGAEAETATAADWLELGQYAWTWDIPDDQDVGLYTIRVDYVIEQPGGSATEYLTETFVVQEGDTDVIAPVFLAYRALVETLIGYSQRIPVFHEIGRLNEERDKAVFSFPRWNQPSGTRVFVNGNLITSGFDVDYINGEIDFTSILSAYDEIQASYNFRWFTDDEIDMFVQEAVDVFNQYPPHSVYTVGTLTTQYTRAGITVATQAAVFALRRLIMDLHFQEPAKVFGGMERADKLIGSLSTLKENMEEDLVKWYEQKAKGPYHGLTRTITVPEFTLPGGRSRWFRYLFKGAMLFFPLMLAII